MNQKKSILVVDDDYAIRNTLFEFLLRKGYHVGIAENGEKALDMFNHNHFDLVLTDFRMPLMDGIRLASEIKKKRPETIIIVMSGDRQVSKRSRQIANHFVEKPFKYLSIYNLMHQAFESEVVGKNAPLPA